MMGDEIERTLARTDRAACPQRADALVTLGLDGDVNDEEIRSAFRARLKTAHPDLNGGTDVLLRRLILARDLLMLDTNTSSQASGFTRDLTDAALPLTITLQQAVLGGEALVEVPALEHSRAHEPLVSLIQTKTLRVTVPAGLRDGERVTLDCQGGIADRLNFIVRLDAGAHHRVSGDDIWTTAQIEPRIFFHGGRAVIDTPWGPREIEIGRAFPRGSSLRLKGLGLPGTASRTAGDLHVRLEAHHIVQRAYSETLSEFRQKWAS